MLWDMKFRPAKEKAAASELPAVEADEVDCPSEARLAVELLEEALPLETDNCKLLANETGQTSDEEWPILGLQSFHSRLLLARERSIRSIKITGEMDSRWWTSR
jgi:hypothetical protein